MGLLDTLVAYTQPKQQELDWLYHNRHAQQDIAILKQNIVNETSQAVYMFLAKHVDLTETDCFITATGTRFNIDSSPYNNYVHITNLKKINDARFVNKFFESINSKLAYGGLYINCVETYATRRHCILKKYWRPFNWLYYCADLVFMRIFPKLPIAKKIYFFVTKGRNRVLTRAEIFGRLYSCGFEVIDEEEIDNKLYFVARKIKAPVFDKNPSYGLIYKMPRVGKNGKIIGVYKFRTMHPYAEYLQDYVIKKNGYGINGKPANDFRLAPWGKFLRKYWLDELPQLLNVLKGDMKLVGIRPLSKRFLAEYPEDVKAMRLKHKPGCVPPYVALLKQEVSEYIESERTYLLEKERNPYTTDIKYFTKAVYNILTNKIRSA